ncbi:hypothetical protein TNCV_413131 [Trichonephila clavipes]|nr:hypothetical protein TNCV_413131 [Trichonephila clavipes]
MRKSLNTISLSICRIMCESGHLLPHSFSNVLSCWKPPTTNQFLNLENKIKITGRNVGRVRNLFLVPLIYFVSGRKLHASRRAVLLARWIVRSVPLEIVGSSGHDKVPTRGKPGLERPGRPRGERIEGSCGKHLGTLQ